MAVHLFLDVLPFGVLSTDSRRWRGSWPQLSPRRRPFPSLHEQTEDLVEQPF